MKWWALYSRYATGRVCMFCFSTYSSETESFASYSSQITNQVPCKNVPAISTLAKVEVLVGTSRDRGATVAGWSMIHSRYYWNWKANMHPKVRIPEDGWYSYHIFLPRVSYHFWGTLWSHSTSYQALPLSMAASDNGWVQTWWKTPTILKCHVHYLKNRCCKSHLLNLFIIWLLHVLYIFLYMLLTSPSCVCVFLFPKSISQKVTMWCHEFFTKPPSVYAAGFDPVGWNGCRALGVNDHRPD